MVGILLVFALLIGPPATAIRLVHQPLRAIILAIILGLAYTWLGILLGGNSPWPVSFFITALSFGVYLPVRLLSKGINLKRSAKGLEKLSSWIPLWRPRKIAMIDILRHSFVQNAFFAGGCRGISGFVGYFVVLRGQAFTCEALSHVGFTGALGAALVGASSLEGMFLFT